jgi:SAM-dependent methyltransferase
VGTAHPGSAAGGSLTHRLFADTATKVAFSDAWRHAQHMTHSFDGEYWDQIWTGEREAAMATSEPSPYLAAEVSTLAPGTALDAGCGAGAEAIWLASRGWQVTGADIAAAALAHAGERADASGLAEQVTWVMADLSTWEPGAHFDLVTTHYAHPAVPQLEFYDRIATWVAPGGTLLIVGHLHHEATGGHEHGNGHGDGHGRSHGVAEDGPPAEAAATAAAITARLDPAHWLIVTAEETHRTVPGHGTTLHDVVVRATRRS